MENRKLILKQIGIVSVVVLSNALFWYLLLLHLHHWIWRVLVIFCSIASIVGIRQSFSLLWKYTFAKEKMQEISDLVDNFNEFFFTCKNQYSQVESYLSTNTENQIIEKIKEFKKRRTRYIIFWEKEFEIFDERIYELQDFFKNYNKKYLQKARQQYKQFFNGAEYNVPSLNEKQIDAVLINDNNNLVVAGPGSGKTKVLVDRVVFYNKYKFIPGSEILVLAYNTSAAEEIRRRLKEVYSIENIDIRTMHSLGYKILNRVKDIHDIRVAENTKHLMNIIVQQARKNDPVFQQLYIRYFEKISEYLTEDDPEIINKMFSYESRKPYEALDGTRVKSIAEKEIANIFIRYNIKYDYEKTVEWCDTDGSGRKYRPDFYLPDFDIYLEHWGIPKNGPIKDHHPVIDNVEKYKQEREWKRNQFRIHNKELWETDFIDWKAGKLQLVLDEKLTQIAKSTNTPLKKLTDSELIYKIDKFPHRYTILINMIHTAITDAKVYGYTPDSLSKYLESKNINPKDKIFLNLVFWVFALYQDYLKENHLIDFEDMINQAVEYLENLNRNKEKSIFSYSMIFVDEFQDISYQRLNLLKELQKQSEDCRMFFVGDDWQSIYGFSGSSNKYMVNLEDYFSPLKITKLNDNYRNPQPIIDFGESQIVKCSDYIPKDLSSISKTSKPSLYLNRIECWRGDWKKEYERMQNEDVVRVIKALMEEGVAPSDIMVLSRFNFGYTDLKEICKKDPEIRVELSKPDGMVVKDGVRFMSMHKAKGLESDYVILLNVYRDLYGFPAELSSSFNSKLINPDLPDEFDEERRLFFVALTRARKEVHIYTWKGNESEFLSEIPITKEEYLKNLKTRTGTYKVKGSIVNSTPQAICCQVKNDFQEIINMWLPKSVAIISSDFKSEEEQVIYIKRNFVESHKIK